MTTKILTGTYADGYSIQAPITTLSVGATGYVTGAGIYSAPGGLGGAYTIVNTGRINGYVGHRAGVYLQGGGMITNGARGDTTALLEGDAQGIVSESLATVVNYGTITSKNVGPGAGGIGMLLYSGVVTNGVAAGKGGGGDTTALIHGYYDAILFSGAAGTVTNYGSITAAATGDSIAAHGVITLREGGRVTNGSAADTTALIDAYSGTGVTAGGGSVVNNGTIAGAGSATGQYGVLLTYGASLTNGSLADHVALIEGYTAVAAQGAASNVTNYGSIISTAGLGQGLVNRTGVDLYNGALTNGAAADTAAFIKGYDGVDVSGAGTVTNFGAIDGADGADGYYGVVFAKGGRLTNGSTLSQSALIAGTGGAGFKAGEGTVANFGTIQATGAGDFGVAMYGGLVTNGALADENARIDGPGGVSFAAAGTAINFGTVEADGGVGVKLFKGGRIVNGSAADQNAVIEATLGVYATGGATTLINYGVINGAGGTAVQFMSSADVLVVETSSNILGDVLGGGGSLGLACGGTISGVAGGDVTVSGGVPTKTFTDFGTVILGAGKVFTLSGPGTVIGGQTLDVAGALGVSTALGGAGTLAVTGVATFNAGTSLTLAKITMAGAGAAVNVDTSLAYAGSWNQSAGTLSVATGDKLTFTGTGDHFAGTVAGAGTVAFTAGSDTLAAATLSVANLIISTATIALSGSIDLTG